jgi:flagellar hook assembly protein FlgD
MLKFGATLGSCDDNKSLISELGKNAERVIAKENNPISPGTQLKIYPNPVTSFTNISFSLPQCQKVSIQIFDMMGRLVKTLTDAQIPAGTHQLVWNSKDEKGNAVVAGIYLLNLQAGDYTETKKISIVH